jgi:hypothetical protein
MDDCQTILHGAVAVEDGVITAVGEPPDGQRFDRTIDAAAATCCRASSRHTCISARRFPRAGRRSAAARVAAAPGVAARGGAHPSHAGRLRASGRRRAAPSGTTTCSPWKRCTTPTSCSKRSPVRTPRHRRQIPDGFRRRGAAGGCRSRGRQRGREPRARAALGRRGGRTAPSSVRAAVCRLLLARPARRRGRAVRLRSRRSSTRMPPSTGTSWRSCARLTGGCRIWSIWRRSASQPRLCAAHCVWVSDAEQALMAPTGMSRCCTARDRT